MLVLGATGFSQPEYQAVDGIADSRLFEPGERPNPGQAVMVLLAGEQVFARVYVPEQLRVHVTPGQQATIHVDGLATPVAGRVHMRRGVRSRAGSGDPG